MSNFYQIELQPASILNIPFEILADDFTFVVNGKEYKTNHIIADIISPKISKMHLFDPTIDKYIIDTFNIGNFEHLLQLINFRSIDIEHIEIPFIEEVLYILGSNTISIEDNDINNPISFENIFGRIKKHEKKECLFSNTLMKEIDFLSSNFYTAIDIYKKETKELSLQILERVLLNPKLRLFSEDQLLNFINELYILNGKYSILYEYVEFTNVTNMRIVKFINIFNFDMITQGIRKSLLKGLLNKIMNIKSSSNSWRYQKPNNSRLFDSHSPSKEEVKKSLDNESNSFDSNDFIDNSF